MVETLVDNQQLFKSDSGDDWYTAVKSDEISWHENAKKYWNSIYQDNS